MSICRRPSKLLKTQHHFRTWVPWNQEIPPFFYETYTPYYQTMLLSVSLDILKTPQHYSIQRASYKKSCPQIHTVTKVVRISVLTNLGASHTGSNLVMAARSSERKLYVVSPTSENLMHVSNMAIYFWRETFHSADGENIAGGRRNWARWWLATYLETRAAAKADLAGKCSEWRDKCNVEDGDATDPGPGVSEPDPDPEEQGGHSESEDSKEGRNGPGHGKGNGKTGMYAIFHERQRKRPSVYFRCWVWVNWSLFKTAKCLETIQKFGVLYKCMI